MPEENNELQERIKKGCTYFLDTLQSIEKQLKATDFDADNKSVKKHIEDALENLSKELFIKQSGLKLCSEGFKTLAYLKTKANAEIDFSNSKKAEASIVPPKKTAAPAGVKHGALFQTIKKWRDDLATDYGVPVYQVLPQKVLADLANKLPSNFEELESIKGIGKKSAERIILELRDKLGKSKMETNISSMADNSLEQDALNALIALGIARPAAENAIRKVMKDGSEVSKVEDLIKKALKTL